MLGGDEDRGAPRAASGCEVRPRWELRPPLVSALTGAQLACSLSVAWLTRRVPPLLFQAWKANLMGPAGSTMNLRTTHVLHTAPAPPPGEVWDLAARGCRVAGSPHLWGHTDVLPSRLRVRPMALRE